MKRLYLIAGMLVLSLLTACAGPQVKLFTDATDPLKEFTIEGSGGDKILLVPIRGLISDNPKKGLLSSSPSMVQQVVSQLKKAEQDKRIKAVLFKINSPGGSITASDLLYHEILSYKERTNAKVIVCMMDMPSKKRSCWPAFRVMPGSCCIVALSIPMIIYTVSQGSQLKTQGYL